MADPSLAPLWYFLNRKNSSHLGIKFQSKTFWIPPERYFDAESIRKYLPYHQQIPQCSFIFAHVLKHFFNFRFTKSSAEIQADTFIPPQIVGKLYSLFYLLWYKIRWWWVFIMRDAYIHSWQSIFIVSRVFDSVLWMSGCSSQWYGSKNWNYGYVNTLCQDKELQPAYKITLVRGCSNMISHSF